MARLRFHAARPLVAVLAITGALATSPPPAAAADETVHAVADTYVAANQPDRNWGGAPELFVDAALVMSSYLRFEVPGGDAVVRARLEVYVTRSTTEFDVWTTGGGWSEYALTYATAPAPSALVARSGPLEKGSWASIDVTAVVRAGTTLDLTLVTGSHRSQAVGSRESPQPPRLVLERAPAPTTTAATTTTTTTSTTTTSTTTTTLAPTTTTTTAPATSTTASPPSSTTAPSSTTTTTTVAPDPPVAAVTAHADAYANSASPESTSGSASAVWFDASPAMRGYLGFDVPVTAASLDRAWLEVYVTRSTSPIEVRPVESAWDEATLAWSNAPTLGAVVATSGPVQPGTWVRIDVSSLVTGPGDVSVGITTASTSSQAVASRESSDPPRLVLDWADAGGGTSTSFFVDSTSGDDDADGTSAATAWRTLARASAASLGPGDRILLARGRSFSGSLLVSASGTAAAPIVVAAYGDGAAPVVTGARTCVGLSGSFIHVADLDVRNCTWAGLEITGDHTRVEGSNISGNAAGIYVTASASHTVIMDNELVDNDRMSVLTAAPTNDDSGAFAILLHGDDTEIAYNTISGSDAFSYDYGRDGAAIEIYGARRSSIHHNLAVDNDAFAELGNSRATDNTFSFNVVRSTLTTSVFLVTRGASSGYGPVTGTTLHRNTVSLTGAESQGVVCHAGCNSTILTMRDNVVVAVWKALYADGVFDEDDNLFWGGAVQSPALGASSIVADPQFVDASAGDLRVTASSPVVDRGRTTSFPTDADGAPAVVDGDGDGVAQPDLGAYERHAGDSTAPVVRIASPPDGTRVTAAGPVFITASASDDVGVVRVEFVDGSTVRGTEDTAPYGYTWNPTVADNGTHRWTAVAYDADGHRTTSAPVDVVVDIPPAPSTTTTVSPGPSTTTTSPPAGGPIVAAAETDPVPHAGDAADDAAVWLHPTDRARSTIIGTDKLGGLGVYGLDGRLLHWYPGGRPNNVDLRYDFPLGGRLVDLVVISETDRDTIRAYVVDPSTRGLVHVSARDITVGIGLYGLCMYVSPTSGRYYVFDSDSSGTVQQWELFDNGAGAVDARRVRQFTVSSTTEGCVADDVTGALYLAQEDVAIWRYGAEPGAGTSRASVDTTGAGGHLTADIEGLSIYYRPDGTGYLLASSQGSGDVVVYRREGTNPYVTRFAVGAGVIDGVSYTDGLDVTNAALGAAFPDGLFVVQDDRNDTGNQNFKLVSWGVIARGTGSVVIDTTWDPRAIGGG